MTADLIYSTKGILLKEGRFPGPTEVLEEEVFRICEHTAVWVGNPEQLDFPGCEWTGLRESCATLTEREWALASKGMELINWDRSTRYCPACGRELERKGEIMKKCPGCGKEHFPQLSPAMVVLVTDGPDRALLVHARNFRNGMHALVAGFVETGESLEECVAREVMEETGLEVTRIRYVGSQSWPFPSQLMVGFTARLKGGSLEWRDGELTAGAFFDRREKERLPLLPAPPSLSWRIIRDWLEGSL